ncbi:TniQ family protein [Pandoraea sp. NPDC090278]|uniref:TniQ family protein n=1 Tax=Pandoraea sp. NPDC090278 TaxID=3364391 RepID=UPI00383A8446
MQPVLELNLFPASLPDETMASRASRYHLIARHRTTRESFERLFGKPRAPLSDIVPPDLPALAQRLPGDGAANLEQLLRENTLYPLVQLFDDGDTLGRQLRAADARRLVRRRTLGLPDKTKLCEQCVRDDLDTVGSPYVHRAHQVPGVAHCWRHRTVLLERCPSCGCPFERPRELLNVPWKPCVCGYRLGTEGYELSTRALISDAEFGHAVFVKDLLFAAPGTYPVSALVGACTHKLRELGLGRGRQGIDRHAARVLLEDYYGDAFLCKADPAYAAGKHEQWFRMGSMSGARDVPLGRHLLTAHFLFSGASQFVEALDTEMTKMVATGTPPERAGNTSVKTLDKISRTVEELSRILRENPRYTLDDLWARYHGTLSRLVKWDAEAFETIRALAQKPRPFKRVSPRVGAPHPRDEEYADRLRQAALKLYASTDRPSKISRRSVGRAGGLIHVVYAAAVYPRCVQVVEEFAESAWYFYARRYVWALSRMSATDAPGAVTRFYMDTGIWHYKFIELDAHLRKRLPASIGRLREGQVIAILHNCGIDLKWEGPCPEKSFANAGRAYVRQKLEPSGFFDDSVDSVSSVQSEGTATRKLA